MHYFFFLFFLCSSSLFSVPLLDLNEMAAPFIEETKQIVIPGYPDAFNPSIVEWKGKLLLSFRIRCPKTKSTNQIGFVWLDKEFTVISKPKKLIHNLAGATLSMTQDPRLVKCGGELFLVCNDSFSLPVGNIRRMIIGKLTIDKKNFTLKEEQYLLQFEGEKSSRHEKNWVPFVYSEEGQEKVLLAQTLSPHDIVAPKGSSSSWDPYSLSSEPISWGWGELRGGTPALLTGSDYLAFFHSSVEIATIQSKGKKMQHYFMGAYTFRSAPPFEITHISSQPIVGPDFYTGPEYKTWKPLLVVFPGGLYIDKNFIWVAYGKQDHECWVVKLNKKLLLASLISTKVE